MKKLLTLIALLWGCSVALAQSGSAVKQGGNITPGHPPVWQTNGIIGDGGTPFAGTLSGVGVTYNGSGICQNSAPTTGPFNRICLGTTTTGGGLLSFTNFGGGTGGLVFNVNGTDYPFPFAGVGTVTSLTAGTNITLSTNPCTSTCTISATSSGGSATAILAPVQLATTGSNITLSGEQTIDGVLTSTSRVLVKNQTTASQNGVYITNPSAWSRASDFSTTGQIIQGTQIYVTQGTINAGFTFQVATATPVIGSSIAFTGSKPFIGAAGTTGAQATIGDTFAFSSTGLTSSQPTLTFNDNNSTGGWDLFFAQKDSNGTLQTGAAINGGLAVNTAGSWQGDTDIVAFNVSGTALCVGFTAISPSGVVPCADDVYALGWASQRWSDAQLAAAHINQLTITGGSGSTLFAGQGYAYSTSSDGLILSGYGSVADLVLASRNGSFAAAVINNSTTPYFLVYNLLNDIGSAHIQSATSIPAGGTTGQGIQLFSTSNFGIYAGSGTPTLSAATGSLYLQYNASSSVGIPYYNSSTGGSGITWTQVGSGGGGSGCTVSGGAVYNPLVNNGASGCQGDTNATLQDGALVLGTSSSFPGSVTMYGSTSGTAEILPTAVAGTATVARIPAISGTDTLAVLALAQAFTHKTITDSSNVLGGVTMTLGSDATGDIYYRNSSGDLTRLAIGTTAQVLTVAGGLPSWAAAGTAFTITANSTATSGFTAGQIPYSDGSLIQASAATLTSLGALSTIAHTITSASATALAVGLNGATNPAFVVNASTALQAAGLKITGAATGGTVAVAAIDSGSNTNVTINAKGSGTIGIGTVSTGAITLGAPVVASGLNSSGTAVSSICIDASNNVYTQIGANCYSGGSASAAGSTTQVQYNSSGILAADAYFTYAGLGALTLGGTSGAGVLNLGSSGKLGSIVFGNATSGSVTLKPVTGALGTKTLLLPDVNDTIATLVNFSTALPSATSSQVYIGTGSAGVAAATGTPTLTSLTLSGGVATQSNTVSAGSGADIIGNQYTGTYYNDSLSTGYAIYNNEYVMNLTGTTGGTSSFAYTFYARPYVQGSGTLPSVIGFIAEPYVYGAGATGAITNLDSLVAGAGAYGGSASETIATVRGIHVYDQLSGGASSSAITTQVGLDINNLVSGVTNYAIRTGTGIVSLGDTTFVIAPVNATSYTTGAVQIPNGGISVGFNAYVQGNIVTPSGGAYSVVCNDSTANQQVAINAALASGGVVTLSPGVCKINGAIAWTNGTPAVLKGAGQGSTIIVQSSTSANGICVQCSGTTTPLNYAGGIYDLTLEVATSSTGNGIDANYVGTGNYGPSGWEISNVTVVGFANGIRYNHQFYTRLSNVEVDNSTSAYILIGDATTGNEGGDVFTNIELLQTSGTNTNGTCINLVNSGGFVANNIGCIGTKYGVLVNPGSGAVVYNTWFTNAIMDTNGTEGWRLDTANGGDIHHFYCSVCWGTYAQSSGAGVGLVLNGYSSHIIQDVSFGNSIFTLNNYQGVYIGGYTKDVRITNSTVTDNNVAASGSPGIEVGVNLSSQNFNLDTIINGNYIGNSPGVTYQTVGVLFDTGSSNYLMLQSNDLHTNTSAPYTNNSGAANTAIANNL